MIIFIVDRAYNISKRTGIGLTILQWAHENGCPWGKAVCTRRRSLSETWRCWSRRTSAAARSMSMPWIAAYGAWARVLSARSRKTHCKMHCNVMSKLRGPWLGCLRAPQHTSYACRPFIQKQKFFWFCF